MNYFGQTDWKESIKSNRNEMHEILFEGNLSEIDGNIRIIVYV